MLVSRIHHTLIMWKWYTFLGKNSEIDRWKIIFKKSKGKLVKISGRVCGRKNTIFEVGADERTS